MTAWANFYGAVVSKEARRFFMYRSNVFSGLLSALFGLGLRYALWSALFTAGKPQDASLSETMTYYAVNGLILVWVGVSYGNVIGGDIRSGDIAHRLIKPFPYHLQLIAGAHANALASSVTRAIPALIAALLFIGLLPPVSIAALECFLVTAVLGGVIYSLVDLIVSYTAFWLTDYWYLSWFRGALFSLFGGTVIPLWFYPGWLNKVCACLPFRYAVFQPMAFYLGRIPAGDITISLAIQLFWIAALLVLERLVWRRAQHKLTVQGG